MDCTGSTPGVGEKVERLLRLGRQRRGSGGVEIWPADRGERTLAWRTRRTNGLAWRRVWRPCWR